MVEEENKDAPAAADAKAPAAKAKKGEKAEPQMGKFTNGDHMVHILFQKGKKFIFEDERTVNLILEVDVNGVKQYSNSKTDVACNQDAAITFDEHMFFELKNLSPAEAKDANIVIRLLNQGWLKNELIGQAIIDLASVYFKDKNKMEHYWIGLDNPDSEDYEVMKGLLKISANCTGPKDNAQKLELDSGPEPDVMKMYMSPSIKRTFYELTISIIEAHDLPEFGGLLSKASIEAYFKVKYGGGNAVKTEPKDQITTQNTKKGATKLELKKVAVNQRITLPVQTPVLSDRLVLEAYDYNSIAQDIKIGSLILSAKQLIALGAPPQVEDDDEDSKSSKSEKSVKKDEEKKWDGGGFFIWRNMNGAPQECDNEAADAMNDNPEIASDWKGKVLLHIQATENDKPQKQVKQMDPDIKKKAYELKYQEDEEYQLLIEIGQGITLPEPEKDYKVCIKVLDHEWVCEKPKEKKGAYVRWHNRSPVLKWKLPKNAYSVFSGKTAEELGKNRNEMEIFIYLQDEYDKLICFWQGKLSEFMATNAKWRWIQLKPDRSYGMVENDHDAGMISVKISAARLATDSGILRTVNFSQELAWKKDPPLRVKAFQVRVFIFQCKDLPAADSDGSSDPFISIFNTSGESAKTPVIEDNINPIFMEAIEIDLDFNDQKNREDAPPIVMDVMDADEGMFSSDSDFLGRCTIYLKDIDDISDGSEIPIPKWHPIRYGTDESSPECGSILCSFALYDANTNVTPIDYMDEKMHDMVETLDFQVFINCLGLRELESIGLIPIQKAFISFMVKSLTDPKTSGQLQNIKTQPGPAGSNPNINSVVKFNIPLPTDELYCPSLSCTVYDQVFLGFSQPVVGTFSIPLGEIMQARLTEREVILSSAKEIITQLKAKMSGRAVDTQDISLQMFGQANNTVANILSVRQAAAQQLRIVEEEDDGIDEVADDSFLMVKQPTPTPAVDDTAADATLIGDGLLQPSSSASSSIAKADGKAAASATGPAPKGKMGKKQDSKSNQRDQAQKAEDDKKKMKDDRRDQARALLDTVDSSNNVSIPNYTYDQTLRVYREVMPPKNELFKPVGFNDQDLIKELMSLMNKIPAAAANNPKVAAKNSKLATKMNREAKKAAVSAGEVQAEVATATDEEVKEAVDLMQQVYDKTNKHYRRFFEDELENDTEIFPKPIFTNIEIKRGQSRGVEKSWFGGGDQDESGQESTIRVIGKFKGVVDIFNEGRLAKYENEKTELLNEIFTIIGDMHEKTFGVRQEFDLSVVNDEESKVSFMEKCDKMDLRMPKLVTFLQDVALESMIKEALKHKTDAIVHLYLIQGFEFASRDMGSASDPFLIVTCGLQVDNDQDNYQDDEPNPKFVKRLDFNVSFPGAPPLVIEAYDYDMMFGNDLIGKTSIDLDDRFFNPKWQAIDEKPIETRELYHSSSKLNQGVIDLWVDIDPATKSSDVGKVWDISKEPSNDFEVRLSVMKCKNVPAEDAEGVSDVFIKCFISDQDKQETDTHYRCQNGQPSFNYRLLFDVHTPTTKPFVITMQAWDRDLIAANDMICEWRLDITDIVRDSKVTKGPMNLQKAYYNDSLKSRLCKPGQEEPLKFIEKEKDGNLDNTFYLTAYHVEDLQKKKPIYLYLDLRIVPSVFATMNAVGAARGEPNVEPNLPAPIGRFKLSLNPFSMLNQMCGPSLRRKIWCCICCIICLVVAYYVFPLLASFVTLFSG